MLNIVLSGGPSSGKTTSISKLESELTEKLGMKVLIVPETATELIANGIVPSKEIPLEDFQDYCFKKQLHKEEMYKEVAKKHFDLDKVVIIYDRSLLDQLAYIDKDVFDKLLAKNNLTMAEVISRYDAIIHLVTAAKGTDCYTTANNVARRETAEEAIEVDERTLAGNMYHPHVRVIDNSTNFEQKIQRVLKEIFTMLNAPQNPSEIERKFLIKYPSKETLESLNYSSKSNIIQTYLKTENAKIERRIRQRGTDEDGYMFYYTEKTPVSNLERIEREEKITMKQYISYLAEADTRLHQIHKTRYCFLYENQYFEMDLYPYSTEYAILEIELANKNDEVKLPDFINVVKEVTDDLNYRNYNIAKNLSLDIKEEWIYETGREKAEILGSGSNYSNIEITKNKEKAFKLFNEPCRNYLIRYQKIKGMTVKRQWYDKQIKEWIDD